jgi:hypothetical protein
VVTGDIIAGIQGELKGRTFLIQNSELRVESEEWRVEFIR